MDRKGSVPREVARTSAEKAFSIEKKVRIALEQSKAGKVVSLEAAKRELARWLVKDYG